MKLPTWFSAFALGLALLLLAAPAAVQAAEVRDGPAAAVAPGETIDDDLFAAGQNVTVAGRVRGDVFALGQTVLITGVVDGDLIAAGQQVIVDGVVNGDVRAGGAVVTVNGQVGRNVTSAAQQVNLSSAGRVGGSLMAAGETITAFGSVGRGVTAGAGTLQLGGPVGGGVAAWAETLVLGPNTRIGGNLEYHSEREAAIPAGTVTGAVRYTPIERETRQEPLLNGLLSFGSLVWLAGTAVLGALAITLAPRRSTRLVELGQQWSPRVFGLGLLVLFAVPIAGVLIAVTIIGLPLATVVGALYFVGLMLARPALGLVIGAEAARLWGREPLPPIGAMLVGLIALHLATHLPVLGGLIAFLGLAYGLGLIVQTIRRWQLPLEPASVPRSASALA